MTLQLRHSEFPYIQYEENLIVFFYQCEILASFVSEKGCSAARLLCSRNLALVKKAYRENSGSDPPVLAQFLYVFLSQLA
jgi:hypothetical protein